MPDIYDQILDQRIGQRIGAPAQTGGDVYDQILDQRQEGETQRLQTVIDLASKYNPDHSAEAMRLARDTGLPVGTVERNREEVARQARVAAMDLQNLTASSPILARQLADPDFAKIAHDDVDNLSTFERVARPARALGAGVTDLIPAAYGVLETGAKLIAPIGDPLAGTILPENPLRRVAAGLEELRKGTQRTADSIAGSQEGAGLIESGITSGFRSVGQMAPGMLASVLTDNPAFALGIGSGVAGSQSATKALDKGLSPAQATLYGLEDAAAEYATERLPVGLLLKDLKAGAPLWKVLGHQIASEVPSEMAATAWQNFNEWANVNPDQPFQTYLDSLPEAEAETVVATITASLVTGGMAHGVNRIAARAQQREKDAMQGAFDTGVIERINELAAASKIVARDADTFETFAQSATEDGPREHVYISPLAFNQSGIAEQLAQVSPSIAAQVQDAVQTGRDVQIPFGEYSARIAPTELSGALLDHIKFDPAGFTKTEAHEYMQSGKADELKAEVERVMQQQEADDVFKASREAVKQAVLDNLNTVGRFTPQVNEAQATLTAAYASVRAAKLGVTPEQFFKEHMLTVAGEGVDGKVYGQGVPLDTTPGFKTVQVGETAIEYSVPKDGSRIEIDTVKTPEDRRGQGSARSAMRSMLATADALGIPVFLTAEQIGKGGPNKAQLIKFYKSLGFEFNTGKSRDFSSTRSMVRQPQQINQSAASYTQDTIEVDGVTRPTTNSNGKPIAQTEEGLRKFWRWFGDSKVVDADGKPLVVYHGTPFDFAQFDTENGAHFGTKDQVDEIHDRHDFNGVTDGLNTVPVYLAIKNPKRVKDLGPDPAAWKKAKDMAQKQGYDGLVYKNKFEGMDTEDSYVAFNPTQIKSATGNRGTFDPANPNILMQSGQGEGFDKWAGTDRPVIEPGEINDFDFSQPGPFVVRAFHGTTNEFDEFNAGVKGNVEGQFGAVNYFTSSEADADNNYAGEGPDLTNRIELKAERMVDEIQDLYDEVEAEDGDEAAVQAVKDRYGEEFYDVDTMEMARNIVRQELHGGESKVMEVFVRTDKPFVVGDVNSPWMEFFDESKLEEDAIERVADNNGVSVDDVKADFDTYGDEIDEARYAIMDEQENPVVTAVQTVADRYDFDPSDLLAELYEMASDGSVRHNRLEEFMRQSESLTYAERPDDGAMIQSQMIGEIIQELGFDSIILKNANVRFRNMNMEKGTAHIHVFDADNTNIKSATNNSGAYDRNDPNIYRQGEGANRGSFNPETNLITLLKNADLSTFLHESGHYFFETDITIASELAQEARIFGMESLKPGEQQILKDVGALLSWHGINGDIDTQLAQWYGMDFEEKRAYHEKVAESFESYLFDGKAPSLELQPYFQKFRAWLLSVYKSLKDFVAKNPDAGQLTDEVRGVFDRMLASTEEIQNAERGRHMLPLFETAEQAGMSPEGFAEYHSMDLASSAEAIDELQAKGLRDMQWARNARSRVLKRLQKESADLRRAAEMDARREVMSQPVYKAWAFLTRKLTDADKIEPAKAPKSSPDSVDETADSLFVAIAKLGGLDKDAVLKTWGVDPADKPQSGLFGKPVWRVENGRSLDDMAEALGQYGYLNKDEHGKVDLADFERQFDAELRGDSQYSNAYAPEQFDLGRPGDQVANPTGLAAGRLDAGALQSMGLTSDQVALLKARKMVAKDGLHPDIVAELPGIEMTSGDELLKKLLAANAPKEEIAALTDTKMLEQHGELSTAEAIEKAADRAIHNEVRARMVATELNALAKGMGNQQERRVLVAAAKQFAEATVSRLKVRNVRPSLYANAEAKAARAAEKALKAGNRQEALTQKRNQLINIEATRAAYNAQDEIDKGLRYLKKFGAVVKGVDVEYQAQINALLERFDLRQQTLKAIDRKGTLAAWINAQREAGMEPDIPADLENEAFRKPYKNMTVEEFRGLIDTVKQIEHLGRLKKTLLTAKDKREYEAVRDEITASIHEHARDRKANARSPDTLPARALQNVRQFWASHIKSATWAYVMDGGKDGGPVWEYFVRSANERGDMETTMRAEATKALHDIMAPLLKSGKMQGKKVVDAVGKSFTREARIAIALNVGNEGNLQRLTGGEGWTGQQVAAILDQVTPDEWRAVQAIWDHFESYRPKIAEKEKRIYGKEPDWIAPGSPLIEMINAKHGLNLRGGYYPIKYDPVASQRAEEHNDAEAAKRQLQGAYTAATTRRSFVKTRAEEVTGRPLLYTLSGVYSGVNDVIHDLAWNEWLIDANRLLRSNTIDKAIRDHYGPEVKDQFKLWVRDIAEGDKGATDAGDVAVNFLRQSVSVAGLGFNLMTAIQQPLGFTQSIVRIGPKWAARGISKYVAHPIEMTKQVNQMSSFMENRARTRFRELNELRNMVEGENATKEFVGKYAYWLMMRFQQAVDVPTWWGAYEKAIASGNNDDRAIALADQAVIDSQGGGMTKDLSAIERTGAKGKLFTVFYSFMNSALNMGVAQGMTERSRAKRAANMALLYLVPSVLWYALKNGLTPGDSGDDDPEKLLKKLLAAQIDYMMGTMVYVREFSDVAKTLAGANDMGRDYQGPAGLRVVADAGKFAQQLHQGDLDDALRKSFVNIVGDLFGLPSAQINRTVTGTKALSEGKTQNPAAVVFGYQERH